MTERDRAFKVFVSRRIPAWARRQFRSVGIVSSWNREEPAPREVLLGSVSDVDALICIGNPGRSRLGIDIGGYDAIDGELLNAAPRLRLVVTIGGEVNHIDMSACTARGVMVANTPAWTIDAVADHTFALLLASAMRIPEGIKYVRQGRWQHWSPYRLNGADVTGATLGLAGLGKIGACVARRAKAFGMTVQYADPVPRPDIESLLDVHRVSLEDLLASSDFVSLHVPPLPTTTHLIRAETLASMRRTAHLVNTSRGEVVDTEALVTALRNHRIAGAALDVTDPDPLPATHPLLTMPNVIVTPHLGSSTVGARHTMTALAVDAVKAVAGGRTPQTLLNTELAVGAAS